MDYQKIALVESLVKGLCSSSGECRTLYRDRLAEMVSTLSEEEFEKLNEMSKSALNELTLAKLRGKVASRVMSNSKKNELRQKIKDKGLMAVAQMHGMSPRELRAIAEEIDLDEAKSASGYNLYHKTFSGAMQHAYDHAKKKGHEVHSDEIDNKVATGPKKPSSGKTNSYILKTKNGKKHVHIQVANLDDKRYELNTYVA